jgi:predicted transcriptional regulator of viral defense system
MPLKKYINRLKYVDYLIKRKATGDLDQFAEKNHLCKSAMAALLNEMKELGFPIKFDRLRKTYYYEETGEMVKELFVKDGQILTKEEVAKIGVDENLCFSELTVFELCKKV